MKRTPLKRKTPLKRRYRLARVSVKRRAEEILYHAMRAAFLHARPYCQFLRCFRKSRDVHHKRGRGKYYLDERTWMAICRWHHDWIHDNMRAAESLGYVQRGRVFPSKEAKPTSAARSPA